MMRSCALVIVGAMCSAADPLSALRGADFSQLEAAAGAHELGDGDDPVPFLDMPPQFSSAITLFQTSSTFNQTFTGTIWGSSPSKQQRLSGTQVITNGKVTINQGVTYIEDGSRGIKYTYSPNPNAKDHGVPDVLCKSQAMTTTELARYGSTFGGPSKFAGNVFLADRVTSAFVDTSVPAPALSAIFLDPFKNVPAGMVTKGPRGINSTILIYEGLAAAKIASTEFAVPQGITCTPGEVPSISAYYSSWLL